MISSQGWYQAARRCPSPFFNQRPTNAQGKPDISLLVLHNISLPPRQFGGDTIERFLSGRLSAQQSQSHPFLAHIAAVQVSAHCVIYRTGEVVQLVSFLDRAWHAGASQFAGRAQCNDYSIGIELEGCDDMPYTKAQYNALVQLTAALCQHYAIALERITGHQFIAPLRKTDPGLAFDWHYFRQLLNAALA